MIDHISSLNTAFFHDEPLLLSNGTRIVVRFRNTVRTTRDELQNIRQIQIIKIQKVFF